MNYARLVNQLRLKAFDYSGKKANQFSRILKEAKRRKLRDYCNHEYYKMIDEKVLFRTA